MRETSLKQIILNNEIKIKNDLRRVGSIGLIAAMLAGTPQVLTSCDNIVMNQSESGFGSGDVYSSIPQEDFEYLEQCRSAVDESGRVSLGKEPRTCMLPLRYLEENGWIVNENGELKFNSYYGECWIESMLFFRDNNVENALKNEVYLYMFFDDAVSYEEEQNLQYGVHSSASNVFLLKYQLNDQDYKDIMTLAQTNDCRLRLFVQEMDRKYTPVVIDSLLALGSLRYAGGSRYATMGIDEQSLNVRFYIYDRGGVYKCAEVSICDMFGVDEGSARDIFNTRVELKQGAALATSRDLGDYTSKNFDVLEKLYDMYDNKELKFKDLFGVEKLVESRDLYEAPKQSELDKAYKNISMELSQQN